MTDEPVTDEPANDQPAPEEQASDEPANDRPAPEGRTAKRAPDPGRGSLFWRYALRAEYRLIRLVDPLIRLYLKLTPAGLDRTVALVIVGRGSGRRRSTLLTLLTVDGRWYVGHPNGPAGWTRNLEAAGRADLVDLHGIARPVLAEPLSPGRERDAVLRATWDQQPVPANLIYRAASAHIALVGCYYRLVEDDSSGSGTAPREPSPTVGAG